MSQDQPTESFSQPSSDAPTVRFNQPPEPPQPPTGGPPSEPSGRSRKLIILLSIIGGVILIAVIVLLTLLLSRGTGSDPLQTPSASPSASPSETPSPSPSETPSASPSPSPSPSAAPAPTGPTFATFTAPSAAGCTVANPESQMTFTWSSANAVKAWFGVHTTNAKAAPYEEVPTTATYSFNYQCSNSSEFYTVTLQDASGNLTHKTVTVTDK